MPRHHAGVALTLFYLPPCAVDYILFLQKDLDFKAVPNEVQDTKWVTPDELREMIATAEEKGLKITPWFKLIVDKYVMWPSVAAQRSKAATSVARPSVSFKTHATFGFRPALSTSGGTSLETSTPASRTRSTTCNGQTWPQERRFKLRNE